MIRRITSPQGHFAAMLSAAMDELDLSIAELSKQLCISCEHARRLCTGETLPSRLLVEKTAVATGIPVEELQLAVDRDRMRKGCGPRMTAPSRACKRVSLFEPLINALNPDQLPGAYDMLDRLVKTGESKRPMTKPTTVRLRKKLQRLTTPKNKQRK